MVLPLCKVSKRCGQNDKWATSRENVSSEIFDQVRFKPACSATEASYNFETLDITSMHIILSKQRTTKVLIRLRGCTGWSAPLLFAYGIRHMFAWPGPNSVGPYQTGPSGALFAQTCVSENLGSLRFHKRYTLYMSRAMRKGVLCHMRTTKAQISLCIRAVWSAPLLFTA